MRRTADKFSHKKREVAKEKDDLSWVSAIDGQKARLARPAARPPTIGRTPKIPIGTRRADAHGLRSCPSTPTHRRRACAQAQWPIMPFFK